MAIFKDMKIHFESLGTEMTHWDKFGDLKMHLESLGICMTSWDKFIDLKMHVKRLEHMWCLEISSGSENAV